MAASKDVLRWTHLPFAQNPKRGWLVIGVVLLGCALAGLAGGPQTFLMAVLLVLWSVSPFFLPTTYTLSPHGVLRRMILPRHVIPWERFDGYVVYPDAVYLTYRGRDARSRIHRGVVLPFGPANKESILAIVEQHLARGSRQAVS